jgi:hypothetical protein
MGSHIIYIDGALRSYVGKRYIFFQRMISKHVTFNLSFCLIVLLLLGLLCSIGCVLLLGFVPLGCMGFLLAGLQFTLVGLLYLLLFRIILD